MKHLVKVTDKAELHFTLQIPVPSLVSSSDELPVSEAGCKYERKDDSSEELEVRWTRAMNYFTGQP